MYMNQNGASARLALRVSLDESRSFIVSDVTGHICGSFDTLYSALRFARIEAENRGRELDLSFDENLAMIRAAS